MATLDELIKKADELCFAGGSLREDHAATIRAIVEAARAEVPASPWSQLSDDQRREVTDAIDVAWESGNIIDDATYDAARAQLKVGA